MYRILKNGDLQFPKKGKPPLEIANYIVDTGDPYLFHPAYNNNCKYREFKFVILPCGKRQNSHWCNLLQVVITPQVCNSCKLVDNG